MVSAQRIAQLSKKSEILANILGFSHISFRISEEIKSSAIASSEGVVFQLNPLEAQTIAYTAHDQYGVQGSLTLDEADTLVILELLSELYNYRDETFERKQPLQITRNTRYERYFHSKIEKMTALAYLSSIPFAQKRLSAYLSRQTNHVMRNNPLHMQYLAALKLYIYEDEPQLVLNPYVINYLGTVNNPSSTVREFAQVIKNTQTNYAQRHEIAKELLWDQFYQLLRIDLQNKDSWNLMNLYDLEQDYTVSKQALVDEKHMRDEQDYQQRIEGALEAAEKGNIDLLMQSRSEPDDEGAPSLVLPHTKDQEIVGNLELYTQDSLFKMGQNGWHNEVDEIADLLLEIAHPQEKLSVPRYASRFSYNGSRIHPQAQIALFRELNSGVPQAIWQKVQKSIRLQDSSFDGMDFFLLLDVSSSMKGDKAQAATQLTYCLIEGLRLASEKAQALQTDAYIDVKTQVLAFAAGWAPLTSLEFHHAQEDLEHTYYNLLHPSGEQTIVGGALNYIKNQAYENPKRKVLCLIVGDGMFADTFKARKTVLSMPQHVYVGHINIGKFTSMPITKHSQTVWNPQILPQKLKEILVEQLDG